MEKLKFVILKGAAGFGDRLQCLLQAIAYSKTTNRILVVDWRDYKWMHNEGQNFDYYFQLNRLKSFPFEAFATYYESQFLDLKVYPKIWKDNLLKNNFEEFVYKKRFQITNQDEDIIYKIAKWEEDDFPADVVVLPGVGKRSFKYSDFSHLRLNRWITQRFENFIHKKKLLNMKYDVIHLRAGSKDWTGGSPGLNKKHADKIVEKYPSLDVYLTSLLEDFVKKVNLDFESETNYKQKLKRPVYLISDSAWIISEWQKRFDFGVDLKKNLNMAFEGKTGTHEFSSRELEYFKTTKSELNFDLILDFHIMLNAKVVAHDGVSLFSTMSEKIKNFTDDYFTFQNQS